MKSERIDKIVARVTKKDSRPVLIVVARKVGNDKKVSFHKRCGQFGYWNGEGLSFSSARKPKKGTCQMFRPFYMSDIVSIKMPTKADLIDIANCLFEILEDVEKKKGALRKKK